MTDGQFLNSDLDEALEQLTPESRADFLAMIDDFHNGPFGDAFWGLANEVGEETAKAFLLKCLMGGPAH